MGRKVEKLFLSTGLECLPIASFKCISYLDPVRAGMDNHHENRVLRLVDQ